jgi:hypothetical protein
MLVYPDMHNAFRLNLDKSSSLVGNPDFLPEEIDYWLNNAQDRFVKQRIKEFEKGIKRITDLQTLVNYSSSISLGSSQLGTNVKECSLLNFFTVYNYMYFLSATVFDSSARRLECGKLIDTEQMSNYIADFINSPFIRRPIPYLYSASSGSNDQTLAIIYDSNIFTPVAVDIKYIRQPLQLTSGTPVTGTTNTCELPFETHEEIVNIAVSLVIENIESPRVQSFTPINNSNIE